MSLDRLTGTTHLSHLLHTFSHDREKGVQRGHNADSIFFSSAEVLVTAQKLYFINKILCSLLHILLAAEL